MLVKYIYPPRPEKKIPRSSLDKFDNGTFMCEPKFNGSCAEIYIDESVKVMNRHNSLLSGVKLDEKELRSVFPVNDGIYVGEYMNKSKKDKNGNIFNHKFIMFDIIAYNGLHLLGKTFAERYDMLFGMFDIIDEDDLIYKITENIYLTKKFECDFCKIWDHIIKIDMIEGLVLKQKNSKLTQGISPKNNFLCQIKCRRETKNYGY